MNCPKCKKRMHPIYVVDKRTAYQCWQCRIVVIESVGEAK